MATILRHTLEQNIVPSVSVKTFAHVIDGRLLVREIQSAAVYLAAVREPDETRNARTPSSSYYSSGGKLYQSTVRNTVFETVAPEEGP